MEEILKQSDAIMKIIELGLLPILLLFYREVRNLGKNINDIRVTIATLAPQDKVTNLVERVAKLETAVGGRYE